MYSIDLLLGSCQKADAVDKCKELLLSCQVDTLAQTERRTATQGVAIRQKPKSCLDWPRLENKHKELLPSTCQDWETNV